ncbi:competence protein [Anaerobacillus alkaliphilus]|uniref:Competence protein n=1 Tax=Anaerobacillus alkaliphilus TaxID=1548597 RepID=A0A4Q0VVY3_9BACI|nr:competence protein ComK [Anaerobacillus alkaliphilus]RXJ02242.1 competence protein [Anaerobacillus alkaliphilus]
MTVEILLDYTINQNTIAIITVAHIDYQTKVIEKNAIFYVKKPALELIKNACLIGGSSYEGRKIAVSYHMRVKHKVPIPINPILHIFAFPTHSPTQYHCSWIFPSHVKAIEKHPTKPNHTVIIFKNSYKLEIPVSYYQIEKQLLRSAGCIIQFSELSVTS